MGAGAGAAIAKKKKSYNRYPQSSSRGGGRQRWGGDAGRGRGPGGGEGGPVQGAGQLLKPAQQRHVLGGGGHVPDQVKLLRGWRGARQGGPPTRGGPCEPAPLPVDAGQGEQKPKIRQILIEPRGVRGHCYHFHGGQVLKSGQEQRFSVGTGDGAGLSEEGICRASPHLHHGHLTEGGVRVQVVGIPRRAVQRLVPQLF